ncbi:uncharacterized protein (DUF885 family) [Chromatocurvus halotolerans]|uniref:Uncharacterized protein (DUF885 family) n=1 Tax=Chromatocurvus halotolerans TaxID=1132028 RepID=A0A4R2KTA6_9GAMM|nr:uncharacterized protein (DUF885 family) [Chromatocurvus halotolerans]
MPQPMHPRLVMNSRPVAFALLLLLLVAAGALPGPSAQAADDAASADAALVSAAERFFAVSTPERAEAEYQAALDEYKAVRTALEAIDEDALSLDDQVDHALLMAEVRSRIFEIETVRLYTLHPASYFALGRTNRLFVRPGAIPDAGVRDAVAELKRLPTILENAERNLERPARVWTENALYEAYYAHMLLRDTVPDAPVDDPALKEELLAAAKTADDAVSRYERFLEEELLPRSDRSPAWDPDWIEYLQFTKEELTDWPITRMLEFADRDIKETRAAMEALAKRIHPSGDLRTVWDVMLEEAPAWPEVLPMAQRYVDIASDWLRDEGRHVITIPDYIDYGARISPPMSRRILSFGGATRGPDVAGRQSGYYIITPLEDRLTEEEAASRIRSYNPYWTHVISYHEWLGHNVQIAAAREHVDSRIRRGLSTGYFSQAWSFYLEKLLEDEGYFEDRFSHVAALKHRMGRLQMRQWRNVRITTKLRMAQGEMSFDEAVDVYINEIGMEPTNAFIEVQRDSQTPHPPGKEIIGEQKVLELREEYRRRMGEHYQLRNFNDTLLTYGDLTFKQIRRLMFRD